MFLPLLLENLENQPKNTICCHLILFSILLKLHFYPHFECKPFEGRGGVFSFVYISPVPPTALCRNMEERAERAVSHTHTHTQTHTHTHTHTHHDDPKWIIMSHHVLMQSRDLGKRNNGPSMFNLVMLYLHSSQGLTRKTMTTLDTLKRGNLMQRINYPSDGEQGS